MDFSQTYYGGAQPYQFIGIPPLTPSHSNPAASEDYNNQSPPEVYDGYQNNDQLHNFDQYGPFNHQAQQHAFQGPPGPPTPPTQPVQARNLSQSNGPAKSHQPQVDVIPMTKSDPDGSRQTGSNSDDEDLTPAQSRRKAQNRAAQRAFRERKERHVKDLEAKLASLEAAQSQTASENEKLKRDLQKISTENEILRATSSIQAQRGSMSPPGGVPTTTGPMEYNPTEFYSDLLANHANKTPSHRIVESESGERLLAAGAAWDFIINHESFKKGTVDICRVSELLKPQAKCDGQGPVFEERAIQDAIMQSAASGSDELL